MLIASLAAAVQQLYNCMFLLDTSQLYFHEVAIYKLIYVVPVNLVTGSSQLHIHLSGYEQGCTALYCLLWLNRHYIVYLFNHDTLIPSTHLLPGHYWIVEYKRHWMFQGHLNKVLKQ